LSPKTTVLVLTQSKDFLILACTVLVQLQSVTDEHTDRQTDKQTDRRPGHD